MYRGGVYGLVSVILAFCIPITTYIGCKFTLKAYEMGLKHNYELKNNKEPSKDKSTIEKIHEVKVAAEIKKEEIQKQQDFQELINEYLGS